VRFSVMRRPCSVLRMGKLISVNVGRGVVAPWGKVRGKPARTAIDKRVVEGPVAVRALGLDGDEQCDTAHHGGVTQAVYAYAREDLDWWEQRLDRELRPGMFGENLTVTGIDVNGARPGERWRIGSVVLEVTKPRSPCGNFRGWMGIPGWLKQFREAERPGAYLRVITEGSISVGDEVEVEHRPGEGPTIAEMFRAYYEG
jgi:MOSC domain-containing protein YiiM